MTRAQKYPFPSMSIGDHFSVDVAEGETPRELAARLNQAAWRWSDREFHRRNDNSVKRFSVKTSVDGLSVSVTRVEDEVL